MSITVENCLSAPALREAKVVAGRSGLDKIVTSVTVLEYANYDALTDDYFPGNELCISALTSIKDDVEAQCRIIKRLHDVGEVGLILYYVGVFVEKLDDRLTETADKLGFPLIVMPEGVLGLRYSEALAAIYSMIFDDRRSETDFVSEVMEVVAQFPEKRKNLQSVIRILSDRLQCTVAVIDHSFTECQVASWPMWMEWDKDMLVEKCRARDTMDGKVCFHTVRQKGRPDVHIVFIGSDGLPSEEDRNDTAEVIRLVMNIWHIGFSMESKRDLIRAIINNEPLRMREIAGKLMFDVESIHTMWILMTEKADDDPKSMIRLEALTRVFLKENEKNSLVDSFDDSVVAFMDDAPFEELDADLAEEYMDRLKPQDDGLRLVVCSSLQNTSDVRAAFDDCEKYWRSAAQIFPKKSILTSRAISFAGECEREIEKGEEHIAALMKPLNEVRSADEGEALAETMQTFLLDADSNTKTTGDILFMHKNTVNYRLNKIKKILGYEITGMPEAYALYRASAIARLLEKR